MRCSFLPGAEAVERKMRHLVIDELDLRGDGAVLETEPALPHPAEGAPRAARRAAGQGQPEELDRAPRRVHPRHHRRAAIASTRSPTATTARSTSRSCRCRSRCAVEEDCRSTSCGCRSAGRALSDAELRERAPGEPAALPQRAGRSRRTTSRSLTVCSSASTCAATRAARSATGPSSTRLAARHGLGRRAPSRTILGAGDARGAATASSSTPSASTCCCRRRRSRSRPALAAEMTAYDPTSGELRTHYAGFFDPGFGYRRRRPAARARGRRSRSAPTTCRS